MLVKFLEDVGYDGPRHFDAHAYRTEDYEGVREFARGCMRTYLILRERARQWNADREIQALVASLGADGAPALSAYTPRHRDELLGDGVRSPGARPSWPRLRAPRSIDDGRVAWRQVSALQETDMTRTLCALIIIALSGAVGVASRQSAIRNPQSAIQKSCCSMARAPAPITAGRSRRRC